MFFSLILNLYVHLGRHDKKKVNCCPLLLTIRFLDLTVLPGFMTFLPVGRGDHTPPQLYTQMDLYNEPLELLAVLLL